MSAHVEWVDAKSAFVEVITPEEDWTDPYGQGIDAGKLGLAFGNDDVVVVEGTRSELLAFWHRVHQTLTDGDDA